MTKLSQKNGYSKMEMAQGDLDDKAPPKQWLPKGGKGSVKTNGGQSAGKVMVSVFGDAFC